MRQFTFLGLLASLLLLSAVLVQAQDDAADAAAADTDAAADADADGGDGSGDKEEECEEAWEYVEFLKESVK